MRRRIVLDLDQDMVDYLAGATVQSGLMVDRLLGAARAAVTGPQPAPCPSCDGATCDRCYHTGRLHLAKLYVHPTTDGRATLDLWQGSPGTMQPVATTTTGKDLASITIDALLTSLTTGGLVVEDRRAR